MPSTLPLPLKVGALARHTGLSVRTLHHYDEIGLLVPSGRTPSGHRLYTYGDVQRLQQIQSLRATGFPLEEIRRLLDGGAFSAQRVIQLHLDRLQAQLAQTQRLAERLQHLARHLQTATRPAHGTVSHHRGTIMMEKYFTPEQLQEIQARARNWAPSESVKWSRHGPRWSPRSVPTWPEGRVRTIPNTRRSRGAGVSW